MRLPGVNIQEMSMLVFEFCMQVILCVRLNAVPFNVMELWVVFVMTVSMPMKKFDMGIFVHMALGQMQQNANQAGAV